MAHGNSWFVSVKHSPEYKTNIDSAVCVLARCIYFEVERNIMKSCRFPNYFLRYIFACLDPKRITPSSWTLPRLWKIFQSSTPSLRHNFFNASTCSCKTKERVKFFLMYSHSFYILNRGPLLSNYLFCSDQGNHSWNCYKSPHFPILSFKRPIYIFIVYTNLF